MRAAQRKWFRILLATGVVAATAQTAHLPSAAAAAAPDECFSPAAPGDQELWFDPLILRPGRSATVALTTFDGSSRPLCPGGLVATVRRPDGVSIKVALPDYLSRQLLVGGGYVGPWTIPAGAPAGVWRTTAMTFGTETRAVNKPFTVDFWSPSRLTVNPIPTVTPPAKQTVSGQVTTLNAQD